MPEPCDGKLSCTVPRGDVFGDIRKDVSKSYPTPKKVHIDKYYVIENMNIALRFILALISINLLISCCNEHDDSSGIIVSDLQIGDYWQGSDCLNLPDTVCIREDSAYQRIFKIDSTISTCKGIVLPSIDFNKNSILIYQKNGGGRIFFHRNVQVDSAKKVVIYSISTTRCFCADKCENADQNIVVVPKIGRDYKIEYK
jgi:hypothetical protein